MWLYRFFNQVRHYPVGVDWVFCSQQSKAYVTYIWETGCISIIPLSDLTITWVAVRGGLSHLVLLWRSGLAGSLASWGYDVTMCWPSLSSLLLDWLDSTPNCMVVFVLHYRYIHLIITWHSSFVFHRTVYHMKKRVEVFHMVQYSIQANHLGTHKSSHCPYPLFTCSSGSLLV